MMFFNSDITGGVGGGSLVPGSPGREDGTRCTEGTPEDEPLRSL